MTFNARTISQLAQAVQADDLEQVSSILRACPDLYASGFPLHHCVKLDKVATPEMLLAYGADLKASIPTAARPLFALKT